MLELDGAQGEGGGQILRTSLALSLITGKPFHLRHVRAGRDKPGLQPQHLMSVQAAATISNAATRGATRGSTDLVFEPGPVQAGTYHCVPGMFCVRRCKSSAGGDGPNRKARQGCPSRG
ncbi:MAG: hypothetical protein L0Y71_01405, partial [Gemmataceae bacterium]|nr:hypothetical protein [Gemmataceae bacterium]